MLPPGQLPPGAVAQMHLVPGAPGGPHPGAPHPGMMGQMGGQGTPKAGRLTAWGAVRTGLAQCWCAWVSAVTLLLEHCVMLLLVHCRSYAGEE
jgi:hypothetical protein